MKGKLAMVLVVMLFGLMVADVQAFCVYNNTDIYLEVVQGIGAVPYRRFSKEMPPNGKECCDWQNRDCNISGKRDALIGLMVYTPDYMSNRKFFCDTEIQANGWLTVEGSNGNYRCVRHDYTQ